MFPSLAIYFPVTETFLKKTSIPCHFRLINCHSFNNSKFILQFQKNLLKPAYNSLDLVEVELTDDANKVPRDYNEDLINVSLKIFL